MNESSFRDLAASRVHLVLILLFLGFLPSDTWASLEGFGEFSNSDKPKSPGEILSLTFFSLVALAVVVSVTLTLLEEKVVKIDWIARIDNWFSSRSHYVLYVMRIGVAVTLLWCWQGGKLLDPDLATSREWVTWLHLVVAFLLVFPRTIFLAGIGIFILYGLGIFEFGLFRMLDYLFFVGIGWFLIAYRSKSEKIQISALPALYATLGFCLVWLGIEKLVYPSRAAFFLEQRPGLAMGIDPEFFVSAYALIEISLGFLILVCLQERLLALTIILVFVLASLVLGREELVGQTLIYTVLIVFLFAGSGKATPPLHWIENMKLRLPATALAFMILLATLMVPFFYASAIQYENLGKVSGNLRNRLTEVAPGTEPPRIAIALHKDPLQGWNVELVKENFRFSPASAGHSGVSGEGYAILHINGKKVGRLYGEWYHLPTLPVGNNEIVVTLRANDHSTLAVDGRPIQASAQIEVL